MFPYIRQIKVNDCYTYQGFNVLDEVPDTFKHIILTGKNGSGKTTILNRIDFLLQSAEQGQDVGVNIFSIKRHARLPRTHQDTYQKDIQTKQYIDVELDFFNEKNQADFSYQAYPFFKNKRGMYIFSFFKAHRKVNLQDVQTVTKETDFIHQLNQSSNTEGFITKFKQYLVNKKVYEAFDYMNAKDETSNESKVFFDKLTEILRTIFKDEKLKLEFIQESFEFYLILSDGRKMTFNQLSEGFSAFLSILMDLMMRVDLIRKNLKDFTIDPAGIVLIDEPETHFHLEMQYEILPLLTSLFPNIQFIIATHSPAIISSLKDAKVFDLSSKSNVENWVLGSSYSELMVKHFGLKNEFSPVVNKLLKELDLIYKEGDVEKMKALFNKYEDILTISLKLELESRIIELESKVND